MLDRMEGSKHKGRTEDTEDELAGMTGRPVEESEVSVVYRGSACGVRALPLLELALDVGAEAISWRGAQHAPEPGARGAQLALGD